MTVDELYSKVVEFVGEREDYTIVNLKETKQKKNAIRVDKDTHRFLCFAIMKRNKDYEFRLSATSKIQGDVDDEIAYSYKDNYFFKHSYDSNDLQKLFEIASRVAI